MQTDASSVRHRILIEHAGSCGKNRQPNDNF